MTRTRFTMALGAVALSSGLSAAAGCADVDPKYGPPGSLRGIDIDYGVDSGNSAVPVEAGPPTKPAREIFDDLLASVGGTGGTCLPCHAAGGTGIVFFVAATPDASYAFFKEKNYHVLTTVNGFYARGAHTGPALTPAQQALTQQWAAAEAGGVVGGGGTPPADAGGGG